VDEALKSEPREPSDEPTEANLIGCFGPVRNQQQRGTCVAHAVAAVLECQRKRLLGQDEDTSEQFIYWCTKSNDGHPDEEGTWIRVAAPTTGSSGACLEDMWPYNPTPIPGNERQDPPPDGAVADAANRLLNSPNDLGARNVDEIRKSLDEGRPVAISVPVYNNWYSNPAANALGLIPMPLANSVRRGGHAMCAMGYGYDPEFAGGGYFVLRNSWGTSWAPRSPIKPGYGAIPFLYIEKYGWEAWTAA